MPKRRAVPSHRFGVVTMHGHSLGLTIPAELVRALSWRRGTAVELWVEGQRLVAAAAVSRRDTDWLVDPADRAGQAASSGKDKP